MFGKNRAVDDLASDDFARLRAAMAKKWGPVRLGQFNYPPQERVQARLRRGPNGQADALRRGVQQAISIRPAPTQGEATGSGDRGGRRAEAPGGRGRGAEGNDPTRGELRVRQRGLCGASGKRREPRCRLDRLPAAEKPVFARRMPALARNGRFCARGGRGRAAPNPTSRATWGVCSSRNRERCS